MRLKVLCLLLSGLLCLSFFSQKSFHLRYPTYFPPPQYDLTNKALTQEKIDVGRALFYDPILSKDNSISCASCHSPYNAFSHTDHDLSHGIDDQIGTRNAPSLFNLAWNKSFMWDGAVHHLDVQALAPLSHPKEMNEDISNVIEKLQASKLYLKLFEAAFDDGKITGEHFLTAIAQFQLTLISANSKYDQVKREEAEFTPQELSGYQLYQQHCKSCHTEPLFTNSGFANNGLPVDPTLNDFGKWMITQNAEDSLLFKIPSLRNLSYSYPYMHDGRFGKLSQVLLHYSSGIQASQTLAKELQGSIGLSSNEKADLIAFLLTLDDQEFVFNPKNKFPRETLLTNEGLKN